MREVDKSHLKQVCITLICADDSVSRELNSVLKTGGVGGAEIENPRADFQLYTVANRPNVIVVYCADLSQHELESVLTRLHNLENQPNTAYLFVGDRDEVVNIISRSEFKIVEVLLLPLESKIFMTRMVSLVRQCGAVNSAQGMLQADRVKQLEKELLVYKAAADKIPVPVNQDTVTGLANFSNLHGELSSAMTQYKQNRTLFALLLFSLEKFSDITKTLGRERGDKILNATATRLQQFMDKFNASEKRTGQACGQVLRYAGGKFVVLLKELESETRAVSISHRLLSSMAMPYSLPDLELEVGANIGIAIAPVHSDDADNLLRQAEVALCTAKQKNVPVFVYSNNLDTYSPRKLALMAELRKAINNNALNLVYQPKIAIKSEHVSGVEALLRWTHPEHGFVPPNEFIPLAEQSSVIKPLTVWVLNMAMQQAKAFADAGEEIAVAVNISANCLKDDSIVGYTKMLLNKHGVDPRSIIYEITESAMMQDPATGLNLLNQLHKIGVKISIDDYGTGYSSLAYLKRLPVNEMKIDRAFIKDMAKDEDDKTIVSTTINMGHNFGLQVIAEGVEDAQTVQLLKQLNCDQVQGFYFAKPMPINQFYEWLRQPPAMLASN